MTGWLDPLGVRTMQQWLNAEIARLNGQIAVAAPQRPKSLGVARMRGRDAQLGRVLSVLNQLERPGAELLPHKDLVQGGDADARRASCNKIMGGRR